MKAEIADELKCILLINGNTDKLSKGKTMRSTLFYLQDHIITMWKCAIFVLTRNSFTACQNLLPSRLKETYCILDNPVGPVAEIHPMKRPGYYNCSQEYHQRGNIPSKMVGKSHGRSLDFRDKIKISGPQGIEWSLLTYFRQGSVRVIDKKMCQFGLFWLGELQENLSIPMQLWLIFVVSQKTIVKAIIY